MLPNPDQRESNVEPHPDSLRSLLSQCAGDGLPLLQFLEDRLSSPASKHTANGNDRVLSVLHELLDIFSTFDDDTPLPEPLTLVPFLDLVHLVTPLTYQTCEEHIRTAAKQTLLEVLGRKGNPREVFMGCIERWGLVDLQDPSGPSEWVMIGHVLVQVISRLNSTKRSHFVVETVPGFLKGVRHVTTALVATGHEPKLAEPTNVGIVGDAEPVAAESEDTMVSDGTIVQELLEFINEYLSCLGGLVSPLPNILHTYPPNLDMEEVRFNILTFHLYFKAIEVYSLLDLRFNTGSPKQLQRPLEGRDKLQPRDRDFYPLVEEILSIATTMHLDVIRVLAFCGARDDWEVSRIVMEVQMTHIPAPI
ncbi:hypothetical protein M427DRAFT_51843 [Gonapodya prolifera JEL478]|uniref:Uncharacterized protein n=1 Tax=Gonapodya prolifera (strain JEL478) TaxID=1344416 RepID=A0A139AVZ8_GONPJ|nr:hypothetical protein M427DRAFT_51843 [Gonapodya prolifera JEL478]|eukprot:KXS20887.1 hypothetical protein M427DRAFT_51843 [Gonapodya prolifera JEL478]